MIKVSDYWTAHNNMHEFRQWKPGPWWTQNLQGENCEGLHEELNKRKIRTHMGPDKIRWGYRMEGNFSIQEAYHLARELPQPDLDPVWTKLWDRPQWPKISLFLWLVVRGKILTWENLQKRGFTGPSQCIICKKDREDMAHLLDSCPLASMLWDQGAQRFRRLDRVRGSPQASIRSWHPNPFQNPS